MTVTFVSNYINHHQIPFCEACRTELSDNFHFVQTQPMEQERVAMGWGLDIKKLPYVSCIYEDEQFCLKLIAESDIVIFGWTGQDDRIEDLIEQRLNAGKPVLRISERIYREGQWKAISPRGLMRKYKEHSRHRKQMACLLCAGAYVASDFHIIKAYPDKMFRFGYFPETILYEEEELFRMKEQLSGIAEKGKPIHIVWAGRFLPLKHPEFAVRIAEELRLYEYDYHIHMAGGGELEEEIKKQVIDKNLQNMFTFYGYTEPDKVRRIMEKCHIHLFTSNYLEGWGAVVNEAMNSGCAVVASAQAGAVPYLIRHGENGLVYKNGSYDNFAFQVKQLFKTPELIEKMGKAAYHTITDLWNAEHAAQELMRFCDDLLMGNIIPAKDGPLSTAPMIAPGKKE